MTDDQFRELASGNVAQQDGEALVRSLSHPEPLPSLSLFHIEAELQELLDLRENAEAEDALPDELQVIDERINQYALAEARKVDSIVRSDRACEAFADECENKGNRFLAMAHRYRAHQSRIRNAVLWAMNTLDVKKLGPTSNANSLRVQGNGGVEPLEIYDINNVPRDFKKVTVTMPLTLWHDFQEMAAHKEIQLPNGVLPLGATEVNQDAIRAELKKRVPCKECNGDGHNVCDHRNATEDDRRCPDCDDNGMYHCPRCNGSGTVAATVPGARLLSRGVHLRVE